MTRTPSVLLAHALDCANFIAEETAGCNEQQFQEDRLLRDAMLRNLEVIGQACKDYGIDTLEQVRPDIRWRRIAGFRNQLAHEYLGLDNELIWTIVSEQINPLRQALTEILDLIK
jgi:uncharacterized protein with HEPN domain